MLRTHRREPADGVTEPADDRRARKAVRHEWEAAGRPPCPVCETKFDSDDNGKASLLWRAVVHPFCTYAKVTGQSEHQLLHDPCPLYPECPIPFGNDPRGFCVCPRVSSVNTIILARRFRQPTVKVPTMFSPDPSEQPATLTCTSNSAPCRSSDPRIRPPSETRDPRTRNRRIVLRRAEGLVTAA